MIVALNDELLDLNKKIKYYTFETFNNVPSESGVYAWFYPLRLKNRELKAFIDEIDLVFNFCTDGNETGKPRADVNMGWRKYSLETEFKEISKTSSFIEEWRQLFINAAKSGDSNDIEELKKIIFISSIFMPPLYIGKATNLFDRCQGHISGTKDESNIFHHRFKNYTTTHKMSCRNVEDLILACISTKQFNLNEKKYESLVERILMNLIKPIYSLR